MIFKTLCLSKGFMFKNYCAKFKNQKKKIKNSFILKK